MSIKAVVFDLDGTLLNTLEDIADSMNETLHSFGYPTHPVEAYKYFVGDGMQTLVTRALPESERQPETVERVFARMRQVFQQHWDHKTHPYPGIPEVLDTLARKGLFIVVLTNKPHDFAVLTVQKLLAPWKFTVILGISQGLPPKPDPTGAFRILQQLRITSAEALFLGDSGVDMETARNAGIFGVGVLWGFRTKEELVASGARMTIENPLELLDILEADTVVNREES